MAVSFDYRNEWKKLRSPWAMNWQSMMSEAPTPKPAPAPVEPPAPVAQAPRQREPMTYDAQLATLYDLYQGQSDALNELNGPSATRDYTQGLMEYDKAQQEAKRSQKMSEYLSVLPPVDYSAGPEYPDRPMRPIQHSFVAPQVDVNPWAAGLAALAGIVDPNAAAPATRSLIDATLNRQELARQQARQAWMDTVAAQNQQYEDSMAGYGQDVARVASARDLALKMALANRQNEIDAKRASIEGSVPAFSPESKAQLDAAAERRASQEAAAAKLRAIGDQIGVVAKLKIAQDAEAGKTERVGMQVDARAALQDSIHAGAMELATLNNKAEWQRLLQAQEGQMRIEQAREASELRMRRMADETARYVADQRGLLSSKLTGAQEAHLKNLEATYQQAATNYRTFAGNKDVSWSGPLKAQMAAALKVMLVAEKAYADYVAGLGVAGVQPAQAPADPFAGQVRVALPTPNGGSPGAGVARRYPGKKSPPGGGPGKRSATPATDALAALAARYINGG